jgi:hypothetical protein
MCLEDVCDYLLNMLNEVLHGFPVDFKLALGAEQGAVLEMYRSLEGWCAGGTSRSLSSCIDQANANVLLSCSRLCRQEFEPDEFETRLGSSMERAKLIEGALAELI